MHILENFNLGNSNKLLIIIDVGKTEEKAIKVVRFMIEEKCKMSHHEIPFRVNHPFFKEHGLTGIFCSFGDSPYQVINTVYPGQFQPWEMANIPVNFWKIIRRTSNRH